MSGGLRVGMEHYSATRPISSEGPPEIWNALLESVAAASRRVVSDKVLVVLGADEAGMSQFVESLRKECDKSDSRRQNKYTVPTTCSNVATFSYIDLEDAETEETLGRINLYLLPGYEPAQMPALGDFLRDQDPKDLLICPLLDWRTPWAWIRQLSFMIRHLTTLLDDIRRASPERDLQYTNLTNSLEMRQRTFTEQKENDGLSRFHNDPASALPLEAGELDRPLGVPLLCIAQNSDLSHLLEQEHNMREEHFDFIQQVTRTILLKHGGSLIYTAPSIPETLHLLHRFLLREHFPAVYADMKDKTLDLASTLVRGRVFVPFGWDSWVKIAALREGFDAKEIVAGWEVNLDSATSDAGKELQDGAVAIYEQVIVQTQDPMAFMRPQQEPEVVAIDPLELLQQIEQRQWEVKEGAKDGAEYDDTDVPDDVRGSSTTQRPNLGTRTASNNKRPALDVDSRVKGLRNEHGVGAGGALSSPGTPVTPGKSGADKDEFVQAFFQNLLNRNNSERGPT